MRQPCAPVVRQLPGDARQLQRFRAAFSRQLHEQSAETLALEQVGGERLTQDLLGQELAEFDHQRLGGQAATLLHLEIVIERKESAPTDQGRAGVGDLDDVCGQQLVGLIPQPEVEPAKAGEVGDL